MWVAVIAWLLVGVEYWNIDEPPNYPTSNTSFTTSYSLNFEIVQKGFQAEMCCVCYHNAIYPKKKTSVLLLISIIVFLIQKLQCFLAQPIFLTYGEKQLQLYSQFFFIDIDK